MAIYPLDIKPTIHLGNPLAYKCEQFAMGSYLTSYISSAIIFGCYAFSACLQSVFPQFMFEKLILRKKTEVHNIYL